MKTMRRGTSILLCLALLVAAIPVILPVFTSATAADDQEEQLLGTLSQRFEASGPGVISSGSGDAGGKSYGAYQFSSRSDIPRAFFRWCQSSSDTYYRSIGNRLSAAYDADGGYGSNFDATWRALANEDSDGFLRVQRNYVRRSYYDPIVRSIESAVPGFDMDNYSIALRNVFWSRAVQHGVGGSSGFSSSDGRGGATGVIMRAFDALGGFAISGMHFVVTGVTISSLPSLQMIANGLTTVPTHQLLQFLLDYVAKEPVERILVGLPKQMNNEASENMKNIEPFVRSLKKKLPDMPVEYVDERFTSVLAHRTMLEAGLKKKDRQNKALVDEISATIILQTYLENKRFSFL